MVSQKIEIERPPFSSCTAVAKRHKSLHRFSSSTNDVSIIQLLQDDIIWKALNAEYSQGSRIGAYTSRSLITI